MKDVTEGKIMWKPGTMLYPLPAVMVSCGLPGQRPNIITVAWTGIICTNPPMLSISVRPERFSFDIIEKSKEFTVNLTTEQLAKATDYCGVVSGKDTDKWEDTGLTPVNGVMNQCPIIKESPLSLECKVKTSLSLGSHTMFVADIVNVLADESLLDPASGKFRLSDGRPLVYCHGGYYGLGEYLGHFGFSVRKKK